MRLTPKQCPCGCSKIILDPVCGCQCSSVRPEEARELAVRVNHFEDLEKALADLLTSGGPVAQERADAVLARVRAARSAPPAFPKYPFAR